MSRPRLLVHGARQVAQVVADGRTRLAGAEMRDIALLEGDGGLSVVVGSDGAILDLGPDAEISARHGAAGYDVTIDATGMCVMPGLVDAHTHPLWAGDRVHEFAMKLAGATYMEVHEAGGGIHYTVDCVRRATEDALYDGFTKQATKMLQAGTTLAETKSGYGLDADTEIKMLRVFERARRDPEVALEMSVTYCGAHAVPREMDAEAATESILTTHLPRLAALRAAGELTVDAIDVFCERGVYSVDQTRRLLTAGGAQGLAANFHGEELHYLGSAEMGAELGVRAISHLEEVSAAGVAAMAAAGTVAVLLPTTAYMLRLTPPPARDMLQAGVAVALGSDLNPNAHCFAMPLVLHLACVLLRMTMSEALAAATINAAASLGRGRSHGSLERGKRGDMLVIGADRWENIIYQFGSHHHLIKYVIKDGKIVHKS